MCGGSSAAVITAWATASGLLPTWSASRGREGRVPDQLSQRWPAVFTHIRYEHPNEAIAWLSRVFGFREQVRLSGPDGTALVSELEGPGGGRLMVGGVSPTYKAVLQRVVADFREQPGPPKPNLSHSTPVPGPDVDAHHEP